MQRRPLRVAPALLFCCFFFNDTATPEIYTLSLPDALPIYALRCPPGDSAIKPLSGGEKRRVRSEEHTSELQSRGLISHAVFCLKKNTRWPQGAGSRSAAARTDRRAGVTTR